MLDKFKEGGGLHDLASTGKNSRRVTRKGRVLTAEGWYLLFQEVYQEAFNLAKRPKGDKLRSVGPQLTMTAQKSIFEGRELGQKRWPANRSTVRPLG
jgi:hypothetical protein